MRSAKKYLITLLVDLVFAGLIAWSRGVLDQTELVKVFHILCDSFFVVGVVTTSAGLLIFSTNEGTFDMLSYGVQAFFGMFKKNMSRKYESFYDYRESRADKKVRFGFLIICGLVMLAISMVMLYFYHQYGG